MAVRKKRSVSIPPDLDAEIAAAAAREGMSYSSWLAEAARKEFTIRSGLAGVQEYEAEHGAFTAQEKADADRWVADVIRRAEQSGSHRRSA